MRFGGSGMCHDSFSCYSPIVDWNWCMLCWVPSCIGGLVRLLHAFLDLRSLEILKSVP